MRAAAADVERSRREFISAFGEPDLTVLHGQSWGAAVALMVVEESGVGLRPNPYDGVMLTSGVLAGGSKAYQFRADLRAIYQFYCRNHPQPDEPQYPLWQGLPLDQTLTATDLRGRVNECTGVDGQASERTADQTAILQEIVAVTGVVESALQSHLAWSTFQFQDLV